MFYRIKVANECSSSGNLEEIISELVNCSQLMMNKIKQKFRGYNKYELIKKKLVQTRFTCSFALMQQLHLLTTTTTKVTRRGRKNKSKNLNVDMRAI